MDKGFSKFVDRFQFIGLLITVFIVPLVFFIGEQNVILYNILNLFFDSNLIRQGNQNIVLLKVLVAQFSMFLLFALWLVDSIEEQEFKLVPDALNAPLVAWTLWLVFTTLFVSHFWHYSARQLGNFIAMFLLFFIVQKVVNSRSRLKWVVWTLLAACGWATLLGLLQSMEMPIYQWGRATAPLVSTFGNQNFLAGFLVTTMPVIIGYAIAEKKLVLHLLLFPLAFLQLYVLMATGHRAGFLGLVVGMAVFTVLTLRFFWSYMGGDTKKKWLINFGIGVVVFIAIMYLFMPGNLARRMEGVFDLQQGTGRVRWIMWTGSTRAALDQPLTGHGQGVFQLVFPNYRPPFYHRFRVSHNTRHSHNEYMEVLMETGLIGLTFFLGVMVVFGSVVYRFLIRNKSRFFRWFLIGCGSAVAATLAHNIASVNLRWMSSTFTFWLVLSLGNAAIRIAARPEESSPKKRGKSAVKYKMEFLPELSWKTPFQLLIVGIVIMIGIGFYDILLGDFKLKEMNTVIARAEGGAVSWDHAVEVGEEAIKHNPYSLSALYKLGYVYLSQGRYEDADEMYDYLTDLAPNYAQIHNNIALINHYLERPDKSLLHFEWATRLEDNLRNHMNLLQRYSQHNYNQRVLYHGTYMPRIGLEDYLNHTHQQTRALVRRNFRATVERRGRKENETEQVLNSLYFVESNWRDINPALANFKALSYSLQAPLQGNTYQSYTNALEAEREIDPLLALGLVRQLRGDETAEAQAFRREYLRMFQEKAMENELWMLAVGELLAQQGQTDEAREVMQYIETDAIADVSRFRDVLEYINE